MGRFFLIVVFLCVQVNTTCKGQQPVSRKLDVVFCLDLSASTNGLIDRFRDHLWDYTNLFSQCDPQPDYRIGLIGFSRPSFKRETGYVKVLKDLTYDLESLSKIAYDLKSSVEKGDQYVAHALLTGSRSISWSEDTSTIKVLFVVGNGMPNLGGGDYKKAAEELAAKGVVLFPIYCNTKSTAAEVKSWEEIAEVGKGKLSFLTIKNNYYTDVDTLNIKRLFDLQKKLSETYIYYGALGAERWNMMNEQDRNSYRSNAEGFIYRCAFKISPLYQGRNSSWDLVDYYTSFGSINNLQLDPKQLLPEAQKLQKADINKLIVQKKIERHQLIPKIKGVTAEWEKKNKEQPIEKKMQTLDTITTSILKELMQKKGYVCAAEQQKETTK